MAGTITVSTSAQLYQALANATGGEVIQLAAGDYGTLSLSPYSSFNVDFPSNVTITSADPLHPASFSGLDLRSVSNLTLDGVVCDYTFKTGDRDYSTPFIISEGENITVRNCTFDGDVASGLTPEDNGFGTGIGLSIRDTNHITLEGNEISNFSRGIGISGSTDVIVSGNDLHSIRSDGMNFAQVQGVLIEDNYIHDFRASPTSGDHCDMIQFWTVGTTKPTTDVIIRGNVLDIGEGTWTQSIFMRNELVDAGQAGTEMFYRNITIEQNVITNAHAHGITVGETDGLIIRQNTVLHADGGEVDGSDSGVEIPMINVAATSTDVAITGNVASAITGWASQVGWTVSKNAFVQDQNPGAPGYYGDVFISSSLMAQNGVHDFLALPGGMIDLLLAGATPTREYLPDSGTVAALFHVSTDASGAMQTRVFDASLCLSDIGTLPVGAVFEWTFGDGTTATGLKVTHNFPAGGQYDVSLTVRLPNGVSDTVQGSIGIQDSTILTLGADGLFRATEYEDVITLPGGSSAGLHLGAAGVAATVALTHVVDIMRAPEFSIEFRINADSTTSYGEIFRLHGTLLTSVNANGELVVQANNDTGTAVTLVSSGLKITDLKSHDVDIRLQDGTLQLWLDGKLASQAAFAGTLQDYTYYDLNFGNPWGGKNFDGNLTAFDISVGKNDFADAKTIVTLGDDGIFYTAANIATMIAETTTTATGLHLGDRGIAASVDGSSLTDLLHTDSFNVALTLDADRADSSGLIFRLHDSLAGRVLTTGQLVIRAFEQDGTLVRLISSGTPFTDLRSHDIDIRLQDGKLQLWIDNSLSAEASFDGTLQDLSPRNLDFGSRGGALNFSGDLTAFDITVAGDSGWTSASGVVL